MTAEEWRLEPAFLNFPPGCQPEWWRGVWQAWQCSERRRLDEAFLLYEEADKQLDGYRLNPILSVARHNPDVSGFGSVRPVPPTQEDVVSCYLPRRCDPTGGGRLVGVPTEKAMALFAGLNGDGRRHIMVLSTGRCGTVSLFRLFQDSNLEPYHSYWFMLHPYRRWEFMCRQSAGVHDKPTDNVGPDEEWVSARRAEWLGEKPMIGLNHSDTVFAPVFAAIHPKSRFVYLRRDPEAVFGSFVRKGQWGGGNNHFRPVLYSLGENYSFSLPEVDDTNGTRWHLDYTEAFCRTFGRVMGDRFLEISADRLFGQDREEIAKLLEFTGSDIDLDRAVEHFGTKINEKAHRAA